MASVIVPVGELINVLVQVFDADLMVLAHDPPLEE